MQASEEGRKSRLEYEENLRNVDATHKKYGKYYGEDSASRDYNKLTDGDELFALRWKELDEAKEKRNAAAAKYGRSSNQFLEAENAVTKAQSNYDRECGRRSDLKARASNLDDYKKYHPDELSSQPQTTMSIEEAASITGNPNANIDDQIKAAEVLDRAARERNNNNNNNNNNK